MKSKWMLGLAIGIFILTLFTNCSGGLESASEQQASSSNSSSNLTSSSASPLNVSGSEAYVVPLTVSSAAFDLPLVTVQVCSPGTSNCVTIPNVLVDTGSFGLRVYSSFLSQLNLPQYVDPSGNHVAECFSYGDGSSDWGPVAKADIVLGQERASSVPMQMIDYQFGNLPSDCASPSQSPSDTGFNGILGVGGFTADCYGEGCDTNANNRLYFNCSESSTDCDNSGIAMAQQNQVTNPVSMMSSDNNGVVIQLPAISTNGAVSVSGYMVMGIGTKSGNIPSAGVLTFPVDTTYSFLTEFYGTNYPAFMDTGSSQLLFPETAGVAVCGASDVGSGLYCPASLTTLSAIQIGATGSPQASVTFDVMNGDTVASSSNPNWAFNDVAGPSSDLISGMSSDFDWGLPFFFGRTVYVGFVGRTSSLGTGPYWSY